MTKINDRDDNTHFEKANIKPFLRHKFKIRTNHERNNNHYRCFAIKQNLICNVDI